MATVLPAHAKSAAYLEYIETYRELAIRHQQQYGIPASITLAQGLLESRAGRSRLAAVGNNHFGIKCHGKLWDGKKIYADDDAPNECFRRYDSAEQSFEDHARFLKKKRYEPLFRLKVTDYKGWARTLRQCGYATDKRYADKLIAIIEEYELHRYDTGQPIVASPVHLEGDETMEHSIDNAIFDELSSSHNIVRRNGLYCVEAVEGDTYNSIAEEFGIKSRTLLSLNDRGRRDGKKSPQPGTYVYLEEKRQQAPDSTPAMHQARTGDTAYSIAQQYGIKLADLCKMNNLKKKNAQRSIKVGINIRLRPQ